MTPTRLQGVTLAERLLAPADDFSAHDRDAFVKRADILALADLLREAAAALSVRGDSQVIALLVAGGYVTEAKVAEARSIIEHAATPPSEG